RHGRRGVTGPDLERLDTHLVRDRNRELQRTIHHVRERRSVAVRLGHQHIPSPTSPPRLRHTVGITPTAHLDRPPRARATLTLSHPMWATPTRTTRPSVERPGAGVCGGQRVTTSSAPSAYWARRRFLSNLPTLVLGTSSMNVQCSGSCHLANLS